MSHWRLPPHADARTWLPLTARGSLAMGHQGTPETCARCALLALDTKDVVAQPPAPRLAASAPLVAPMVRTAPPSPPEKVSRTVQQPRASQRREAPLAPAIDTPALCLRRKILLAATTLRAPFASASLVVACFEHFPESFALAGHPAHPDSNKVLAKLVGESGLLARQWIERTSPGQYRVTPYGRVLATQLRVNAARRPA